jgi:hypothetical protein
MGAPPQKKIRISIDFAAGEFTSLRSGRDDEA